MRREELHGLVDVHGEHLAYGLAFPPHVEGLGVETRSSAGLAGDAHIGKEAHLDLPDALALTLLAAPALRVEREARRAPAAHARVAGVGEQAPDRVPEADIGRRAG